MAGPTERKVCGTNLELLGYARKVTAVTASNVTLYDPPLLRLVASGAGTVILVLDGDDETDSTKYMTIALTANVPLTGYAIRQVRTGGTATGLVGAR